MSEKCANIIPYACGTNAVHLPDVECEYTCPDEIRITTLPQQEYILDEQQGFPITVDFSGAVVKAYMNDEIYEGDGQYPDGIIPHSELIYTPTELIGGIEDPGAYYKSVGRSRIVCIQPDHTGGALKITAGVKYCAFVGLPAGVLWVIAASKEPFEMEQYYWDGVTSEDSTYRTTAIYNGETYNVTATAWWLPKFPSMKSYVNYTLFTDDGSYPSSGSRPPLSKAPIDTALEIMFGNYQGQSHEVADNGIVTVSWQSTCDDKTLATSYEVYVH